MACGEAKKWQVSTKLIKTPDSGIASLFSMFGNNIVFRSAALVMCLLCTELFGRTSSCAD